MRMKETTFITITLSSVLRELVSKTFLLLYSALYATCKGFYCTLPSMSAERASLFGGVHIHSNAGLSTNKSHSILELTNCLETPFLHFFGLHSKIGRYFCRRDRDDICRAVFSCRFDLPAHTRLSVVIWWGASNWNR